MESYSVSAGGRPLGVLVIGAGFIADAHVAALRGRTDAGLVGLMDTDPGRAASAARVNGGLKHTADLSEALAWDDVDACIVCTPNDTHLELGSAVAAAGKHLLMEKPLATSVDDAEAIAAAFAASGTVLMAGHTHRFYDYGREVKNVIDEGTIGAPVLVRLALLGGWIWPDWRAWVLDPARSGGHALHNGVHLLDLVSWWIGAAPTSVYARGRKQTAAELDIHDYLEMVVSYADGTKAICEMSRGHRPTSLSQRDVLVIGSEGTLALPWTADVSLLFTERAVELVPGIAGDGFARQLDAWIAAIHGAAPAVSVEDAVRAVALGVAAERSMATGAAVAVTPAEVGAAS